MNYTVVIIFGVYLIVFGVVLLTRKKIIVSKLAEQCFASSIFCLSMLFSGIEEGIWILLIIAGSLILMPIFFLRGKYSIYNIDKEEVTLLVKEILTENNYESKGIEVHLGFLQPVELNLKKIKGTQMYSDILNEIRIRLRYVEKKFFSYAGIAYVGLGILFC